MRNYTLSAFKVRKSCRKLVLGTVMMIPKGYIVFCNMPHHLNYRMVGELVVYVQKLYNYLLKNMVLKITRVILPNMIYELSDHLIKGGLVFDTYNGGYDE